MSRAALVAFLLLLLAALLFACGCEKDLVEVPAFDVYMAQSAFAIARQQVDADTVRPDPTTDECPECYGTGRTGDKISICTACNGTGKKTAADAEPPTRHKESDVPSPDDEPLIMGEAGAPAVLPTRLWIYTSEKCIPCREAEDDMVGDGPLAVFVKQNFEVEREPGRPGMVVPTFIVDGTTRIVGYDGPDKLLEQLKTKLKQRSAK